MNHRTKNSKPGKPVERRASLRALALCGLMLLSATLAVVPVGSARPAAPHEHCSSGWVYDDTTGLWVCCDFALNDPLCGTDLTPVPNDGLAPLYTVTSAANTVLRGPWDVVAGKIPATAGTRPLGDTAGVYQIVDVWVWEHHDQRDGQECLVVGLLGPSPTLANCNSPLPDSPGASEGPNLWDLPQQEPVWSLAQGPLIDEVGYSVVSSQLVAPVYFNDPCTASDALIGDAAPDAGGVADARELLGCPLSTNAFQLTGDDPSDPDFNPLWRCGHWRSYYENQNHVYDYGTSTTGVTIQGSDGDDLIVGSAYDDVIIGHGGNDCIFSEGGDDVVNGDYEWLKGYVETGNDIIYGGPGNDTIYGGFGEDHIQGDAGVDEIHGGDMLYGDTAHNSIGGGYGKDFLYAGPVGDDLFGQYGDDELYGGDGPDRLFGGDGDDWMEGSYGADYADGEGGKYDYADCGGDTGDHAKKTTTETVANCP